MEGAFLGLEEEVVVLDFLQDAIYPLLVYDFVFFGDYNEIIHVDFQPFLCNFFSEDIVHHCLEGCWRVCKAKEHNRWLKESLAGFKGGLLFIPFFDVDVVVTPLYVELGEQAVSCQIIDEVINE
jgi:hypothetical protein